MCSILDPWRCGHPKRSRFSDGRQRWRPFPRRPSCRHVGQGTGRRRAGIVMPTSVEQAQVRRLLLAVRRGEGYVGSRRLTDGQVEPRYSMTRTSTRRSTNPWAVSWRTASTTTSAIATANDALFRSWTVIETAAATRSVARRTRSHARATPCRTNRRRRHQMSPGGVNRPGFVGGSGYWFPTPVGAACWAA